MKGNSTFFTKNERRAYYLSPGISYPHIEDAERGLRDNLISEEQYGRIVNVIGFEFVFSRPVPEGFKQIR